MVTRVVNLFTQTGKYSAWVACHDTYWTIDNTIQRGDSDIMDEHLHDFVLLSLRTDRQTDGQTDGRTDGQGRQTDRQTDTQRQTDGQIERQQYNDPYTVVQR